MSVIVYRLRSALRSNWASTTGLAVMIAVVCGVVLCIAAGAHRTATAADRYTQSMGGGFDALVTQTDGGRPETEHVAVLPSVEAVDSFTFVFGGLVPGTSTDLSEAINSTVFSGSFAVAGSHLIAGREPDPNNPSEFVGSRSFRDTIGASLGDRFTLLTYEQAQAEASEYGVTEPKGPTYPAVLVGISDGPGEIEDPEPYAFFSPALLDDPKVGIALTMMATELRPGKTLGDLRDQIDSIDGIDGESLSIEPGRLVSTSMLRAIDAQSIGLWILAAVAGIAAVAVLGQLVTRNLRLTGTDDERLLAIGYTKRQVIADDVSRAVVPTMAGAVVAVILAIPPSAIFPTGFVGRLEPDRGIRFDPVLLIGAAGFAACILLWATAAVALDQRRSLAARPSPIIEAIASSGVSATAATGVRFAFTRPAGERSSARAVVVGLGAIVGGLTAAIAFGTSLVSLVSHPASYGSNFDVAFGDNGGGQIDMDIVEAFNASPDVEALTLYAVEDVRVGSRTVQTLGVEQKRGAGAPLISEGRLPASENEVALGLVTARSLDLAVGDTVAMAGSTAADEFHVTGIAVLTGFGENEGMGEGALMTLPALQRLAGDEPVSTVTVRMSDKDPERIAEIVAAAGVDLSAGQRQAAGDFRPAVIRNVSRVRSVPFVLAAMLAALSVLSLVHVMITTRRRRRRDFAVLTALGAERGWLRRAVHWQATAFTLVPLIVGVPLGLVVGRLVFTAFAESMGAVTTPSTPLILIATSFVALLVLANVTAAWPPRRGQAMTTAQMLQSR